MIRILVDSASDYSMEEIKECKFSFVPMTIFIGGKEYKGGVDLGAEQFYEVMKESGEFPKTSQPSPQDFLDIFQEVKAQGDEMIYILLSSKLSGTFQSAVLAKNMVDYENIYFVDSLSASHAIRILAEHAQHLIQKGIPAKKIAVELESLKKRVRVLAMIDTMEYLYRGGRVSKATAAIGEAAKIKPLVTLTEKGEVGIFSKVLGKNKAIANLLKQLEAAGADSAYPMYSLYTYGTDNCEVFEERLEKEGYRVTRRLQIGAAIGAHVGPGAFGLIYVER